MCFFCFFAIARSACLRVRSLGRNQHSALVACGLPLLFSPQVWHFVRQDADSTHENIDKILRFLILFKNCTNNVNLFICLTIARSACLRLRPGFDYVRLRWLVWNQHSVAFGHLCVEWFDGHSVFRKHNLEFQVWFTYFLMLPHCSVKSPPPVVNALVIAIKLRGRRATDTRRLTQNN